MNLEVKNIVYAPVGESQNFSVDLKDEKIDDEILVENILGEVRITRLEDILIADFDLKLELALKCDRCLSDFMLPMSIKFKQEYMLSPSSEDDEETLFVSRDNKIEIKEPIIQEIVTSVPVKKLCKDNCKGICLSCGKERNHSECNCDVISH